MINLLEISAHCVWTSARAAREAAGERERLYAVETLTVVAANAANPHLRALAASCLCSIAKAGGSGVDEPAATGILRSLAGRDPSLPIEESLPCPA